MFNQSRASTKYHQHVCAILIRLRSPCSRWRSHNPKSWKGAKQNPTSIVKNIVSVEFRALQGAIGRLCVCVRNTDTEKRQALRPRRGAANKAAPRRVLGKMPRRVCNQWRSDFSENWKSARPNRKKNKVNTKTS
jgi:hypothetical protein